MNFVIVVKPTHICNIACSYCYNEDERKPIMDEDTLRRLIEEAVDYVSKLPSSFNTIDMIWHGGEPMVVGLKYYEKVMEIQKEFTTENLKFKNSIQTNGTLIKEKWIEFFKKHEFSISISIDGPKHLNDVYRVDFKGRGTFDRVFKSMQLLKEHNVGFGSCLVISKANINHADEIYEFMSKNKIHFNVVPMNKSGSASDQYDELGLDADEYADVWIKMYDKWFGSSNEDYIYIMDFALKTKAILHGKPADCVGLAYCATSNISVDPEGDVYACASLSGLEDTKWGNINDNKIAEIMHSKVAQDYRNRQVDPECSKCKWQHVCHGGCLARSYKFAHDIHKRDYYCPSLYKIYEHIEKSLEARGLKAGDRDPNHLDQDKFATIENFDSYSIKEKPSKMDKLKIKVMS